MSHQVPADLMVTGFRTRRDFGVGNLSRPATYMTVGAVVCAGLLGTRAPITLLGTLPLIFLLAGLSVAQRHGMPALSYYWALFMWRRANRGTVTQYRKLLLPHPYALDLPGVAAATTLIEAHDPTTGRPVGVVYDRNRDYVAISTLLAPGGALLAPTSSVAGAIRTWGDVLAGMGTDEQIKGASVTVQITPGAGEALADNVAVRRSSSAPQLAKDTISELVATTPQATASIAPWLTVVIDPNATVEPLNDLGEKVAEALRVMDGVDLSGTGTDVHRRATATDLRRLVRAAYDLSAFTAHDSEIEALTWSDCGPIAADEAFTEYAHDSAVSTSWVLREMPRSRIPYSMLLPILTPGRFPRRVTLQYRVLDQREGEAVVEREISHADNRAEARAEVRGRATWSQREDRDRAEKAAQATAHGAQVTDWTLTVTTTAPTPEELPAARQEVERAMKATRGIRLRPAFGAQGSAFASGLPLGYNPLIKD